jgi:outer membrane immunogenic protein
MQIKLSKISLAVVATTLLLGSTSVLAAHSYKGEGNYKGEAMAAPAAPCVQPLMLKDGFYVGAQAGYDTYSVGQSRNVTVGTTNANGNPDLSANGFVGGLFGGYGMYWNNFYYLAGELFVNDSGASETVNTSRTNTAPVYATTTYSKVNARWSWGVSVLPGLKVNDSTLAFVRLGYSSVNFNGKDTFTVNGVSSSGTGSSRQGAFQYGLGLETAVYQNISVRGEYSHANYTSFTNRTTNTKYSPSNNQFMVGLGYHFS